MFDLQAVGCLVEFKDGPGSSDDSVDTLRSKIAISLRGDDQRVPGSQRPNHLVKVKRDLFESTRVQGQTRHVSLLRPPLSRFPDGRIAVVIIHIGIKAATGNDHLKSVVKDS